MTGSAVPYIKNSRNGVIIRHKEYLGDINPSNAFENTLYPINPGLSKTFPWLSQIADAFQEYEFRGLCFTYKSMSSSSVLAEGANTSLGTVMLATEYNASNNGYENKNQMENSEFSNSVKPSQNCRHFIECARSQTPLTRLYVRTGAINTTTDDIKFYDLGIFQIATQGMQNTIDPDVNNSIGELHVSYEIQFFKPIISDVGNVETAYFSAGVESSQTGVTHVSPFGPVTLPLTGSSDIGVCANGNTFAFAPHIDSGYYMFDYRIYRDPEGDNGDPQITNMVNCGLVTCWPSATAGTSSTRASWAPEAGAGAFAHRSTWVMQVTGPAVNENISPSFNFALSAGNLTPTSSTMDLIVTKVSSKLFQQFPTNTANFTP